jgi:UDP-glucuronate 4-epimerase
MGHILVTGCAGFIGSHVVEKLIAEGYSVVGIDNFDPFYDRKIKEKNIAGFLKNSNFHFIEGDICEADTFKKIAQTIDSVIHLAAKVSVRPSMLNPEAYIRNNILGTNMVLNWMKESSIKKMVFASSSSIYGNCETVPFKESAKVDKPISTYAATKKSCELLNYTYSHLYDMSILNLRFFTVYGPRQRPDLAIRKFVELIKKEETITLFGDGETGRDYTYIDDIVDGIYKAFQYIQRKEKVFDIINIGNSFPITLNKLVDTLYILLKKEQKITYLPMQEGDVDLTYADIKKAKKLLKYQPKTTLLQGLEKFIAWYR